MASVGVSSAESLIYQTHQHVKHCLSQPQLDASQNYEQVCHLLALSEKILATERTSRPEIRYDSTIVTLATLLQSLMSKHRKAFNTDTPLSFLLSCSCPAEIAHAVQAVTNAVSFSTEKRSPSLIQSTLQAHPELAIVQDAHRLASIGATGIGRFFTFEGTVTWRKQDLTELMRHQVERCDLLKGMMKTNEGKRMAAVRTERLKIFGGWWEEEHEMQC